MRNWIQRFFEWYLNPIDGDLKILATFILVILIAQWKWDILSKIFN